MTSKCVRSFVLITVIVNILSLVGCSRENAGSTHHLGVISSAVGLQEAAPEPAEILDLVIDASDGSPASLATVEATIDKALPYAADRPGSQVRVWALGLELSDTRLLATVESTSPKRRGERSRKAEAQRFVDASKPVLMQAVMPVFDHPARKQSPIAEGVSRVAYSRAPVGMRRRIIVVTDARQVGGPLKYDFECGTVPDPKAFVKRLQDNAVLQPKTLTDTTIHFAYVALEAVPKRRGCSVTLARAQQIETAWRAAFQNAGASAVYFTTDGPRLVSTKVGGAS